MAVGMEAARETNCGAAVVRQFAKAPVSGARRPDFGQLVRTVRGGGFGESVVEVLG